jgi:DNA-binding NarL/FixJ family response regulator
MTVRLVLVDDTELVREGLRMVLEAEPGLEVVGEAGDGATGIAEVRRLRPDVVLTDVRMPDVDGIEATRAIVALDGPPVRVLMLTTFDLGEYMLEAVRAGASGFALKDTPPDELIDGVFAIAHGDALIAADETVRVIEHVTRSLPTAPPPPGLDELSPHEREVLELVARGRSDAEIAAELGVEDVAPAVASVLEKLGVRDRVHAVLLAHEARLFARR